MQHASVSARYQLGGMAGGALVGYGTTGSIDGALMGASFGQMGGSIAANFAVACFTAGTPLVVDREGNSRPIDEIEVGDFVLARSEFDPDGPLELKRVEEKFVRTSEVMELVVHGQSIKTTAEHPFFVPAEGKFVAAGELQVGEQLVGHAGKLVQIESIGSTGEVTTVYNLRVADFHTYFVGGGLWGFDVWVHNASALYLADNRSLYRTRSEAFAAAREMQGIPKNVMPNRVMHLIDSTSGVPRSTNVVTEPNASSRGMWYEYLHEGKYKYIVEHVADPAWVKKVRNDGYTTQGHFHIAESPYGAKIQIPGPRERYLNVGGGPSEHIGYHAK